MIIPVHKKFLLLTFWTQQDVVGLGLLYSLCLKRRGLETDRMTWIHSQSSNVFQIHHFRNNHFTTFTMIERVTTSMRPLSGTFTISLSHEVWELTASAIMVTFTGPTDTRICHSYSTMKTHGSTTYYVYYLWWCLWCLESTVLCF